MGAMTTTVTPLRQPPIEDLRNVLQLVACYTSPDVADSDAKAALVRIQHLVAHAITNLGEPGNVALQVARKVFPETYSERDVRDYTAAILHAAVTYESGPGFLDSLPCPICHGDGQVGMHRDGQPIVCDSCMGTGIAR